MINSRNSRKFLMKKWLIKFWIENSLSFLVPWISLHRTATFHLSQKFLEWIFLSRCERLHRCAKKSRNFSNKENRIKKFIRIKVINNSELLENFHSTRETNKKDLINSNSFSFFDFFHYSLKTYLVEKRREKKTSNISS